MRIRLHDLLAEAAGRSGDAPAVTFRDDTLSYAQLWQGVQSAAGGLGQLGLAKGDRVAVYLDKRIETVTAVFATSAADGVFVPVNPVLRARQVAHILADCDARFLVTTAERLETLRGELEQVKSLEQVILVGGTA